MVFKGDFASKGTLHNFLKVWYGFLEIGKFDGNEGSIEVQHWM